MDFEGILDSGAFWILSGVGYAAFFLMVIILKSTNQSEIMPTWVKVLVLLVIPLIAALFSGYAEG